MGDRSATVRVAVTKVPGITRYARIIARTATVKINLQQIRHKIKIGCGNSSLSRQILDKGGLGLGTAVIGPKRSPASAPQMDAHQIIVPITEDLYPYRVRRNRNAIRVVPFKDAAVYPAALALVQGDPGTAAQITDAPQRARLGLVRVRPTKGYVVYRLGSRPVHTPFKTFIGTRPAQVLIEGDTILVPTRGHKVVVLGGIVQNLLKTATATAHRTAQLSLGQQCKVRLLVGGIVRCTVVYAYHFRNTVRQTVPIGHCQGNRVEAR